MHMAFKNSKLQLFKTFCWVFFFAVRVPQGQVRIDFIFFKVSLMQ